MLKTKYSIKSTVLVLALFALTLVITPNLVEAATPAPTGDPLTNQLVGLAQTKLDAEYNVLVSGDAVSLTKQNVAITGLAAQRVNDVATVQLRRNKMLADHGQKYTKAASKLTVKKTDVSKDSATVTAEENVTLTLVDKSAKDPVYTQEAKTHIFHYTKQGNEWKLTQDEQPNQFAPVAPEIGAKRVSDKPVALTGGKPSKAENAPSSSSMTMAALSGGFNPNTAANYAISYWNNYNSAYRTYGNDCTNFTSQALNWAGWQHVGGWYDDAHYWWYSTNPVVAWGGRSEARSWINVHYFYFFARYAGRSTNAQYLSDFRVGDTLQVDFGTPDGTLDHNTIVTQNNGNGNIFLTYHSVNTLNISIWDFIARTPGANYYGTLNKTSY